MLSEQDKCVHVLRFGDTINRTIKFVKNLWVFTFLFQALMLTWISILENRIFSASYHEIKPQIMCYISWYESTNMYLEMHAGAMLMADCRHGDHTQ